MDGARSVVDVGRNRPSRSEDRDGRFVFRRRGKPSLRPRRLVLRGDLDRVDVPDRDADVVPARQLHGEDVLAAEPVVGHEGALVPLALRTDDDRVPSVRLRAIEQGPHARRVVHGIPNRSGRYGLCAARFENPGAYVDAMDRTARDTLNELRWREPSRLSDALLWYRDRTRSEGVAMIRGSEIVDLERRYFTTARARLPAEWCFGRSRRPLSPVCLCTWCPWLHRENTGIHEGFNVVAPSGSIRVHESGPAGP